MATARMTTELVAKIPARVGLLADVAEAIRAEGVNILAISAYERDGVGKFLLVTSDNDKAAKAATGFGAEIVQKSVVAVEMPDRPGALEEAARVVAEAGVDVEYVFGTACGGGTSTVVFKTADDAKVVALF